MNAVLSMPPGMLHLDVPAEIYHRRELGVASSSVLKLLRQKTPAHYKAWVESEEDKETPALIFGRAYHCRVLEPERYAREYLVQPEFGDLRSSTNRAKRDAWRDKHPDATFIGAEDAERIEAMYTALMAHPVAAGILRQQGHNEVSLYWIDERTGVPCKARADRWVPGKFFMDLKSTNDASPEAFAKAVVEYGYDVQHAHYCDGAKACGEPVPHYLILAQEKEAPYACAVYHLDAPAEIRGFALREKGLDTLAECTRTGNYPGYGAGITELSLPAWALKDFQ